MGTVTNFMNIRAGECKDLNELYQLFSQHENNMVGFDIILKELLEKHHVTVDQFISSFGRTSGRYILKWLNGEAAPYKRGEFIKIAIILKLSLDEANAFLTRACDCGKLYPKNIDDAACIHVLLHHLDYNDYLRAKKLMRNEIEEITYLKTKEFFPAEYNKRRDALVKNGNVNYYKEVAELNQHFFEKEKPIQQRKDRLFTNAWNTKEKYLRQMLFDKAKREEITFVDTEVLMNNLCETTDMIKYVRDNWEAILTSNYRLLDYIDKLFDNCEFVRKNGKRVDNINALVTYYMEAGVIDQSVGNKLTTFFSRIKTNGATEIDRNYIILLGILFEMDVESINTMMDLAHMEHLCAKKYGEATIISALGQGKRAPIDVLDILSITYYSDIVSVKQLLLKLFSKDELKDYQLI